MQGPIRFNELLGYCCCCCWKRRWRLAYLVKAAIEKQAVDNWISWSAYNANAYHAIIPPPAIHALLPLFTANAHSTAMLCHSMDITKEAAQCLNTSRYLPVLTLIADQPLFATLREIQWTFSRPPVKMQSKQKNQLAALKSECGLFSRMYISCQTRHGDLDEFFSHENHAVQPALSTGGKLRVGVKSDLLHCLESSHSEYRSEAVGCNCPWWCSYSSDAELRKIQDISGVCRYPFCTINLTPEKLPQGCLPTW